MVRIGIIGLGFMAMTHIKALRQVTGARLVALGNPSGRNLDGDFTRVAGNIGSKDEVRVDMSQVKAYRDLDAMIADPDIDLIDICSPTPAHLAVALAALKAGKHVLCEKPLARTSDEARQMSRAAHAAGKILMPAMCLRFWPEWAYGKEAVASGRYGRVLAARFRRVAEPPGWGQHNFMDGAKSGGALLDLHIHDTDFVQHCFGLPHRVFSKGYSSVSGAIDHVVTQYEVQGGAIVHAEGTWAMTPGFGFNMSYTLHFENATIDYDLARGADALKLCVKGEPARFLKPEGVDGYAGELQHIVDCITNGKSPTVVTDEDGINAIRICEAEDSSIRTGNPAHLSS